MKKKHVEEFKHTILPQLGLTLETFIDKATEVATARDLVGVSIPTLMLLKRMTQMDTTKFYELFTKGLTILGRRHKIDNFVVYDAYDVFVIHNKKLNTSVMVNVSTVKESDDFSVIGCTAPEALMLITQFVKRELAK